MAQEAIMISPDGARQLVKAADLSHTDRKNRFICSGVTEYGEMCGCPMKPTSITPLRVPYFYESDERMKHKPTCSNRKERKETIIEKLDRRGKDITTQSLYEKLNQDIIKRTKQKEAPSPADDSTLPEEQTDEANNITTDGLAAKHTIKDDERVIHTKNRNPRNVNEYAELLYSLPTESVYADRLVFDQILDERTADAYRRFGKLPTEIPFMIHVRKALPWDYGIQLENDQWLVKDFWGRQKYAFLFILRADAAAKQKLFNLCKITPAVKITILCILKKHASLPNTYETEVIKAHMITAQIADDPK